MNLSWLRLWSRRPEIDPEAEAAEHRADELERRAEELSRRLRRRDPWAGPVISTIHGGRHAR